MSEDTVRREVVQHREHHPVFESVGGRPVWQEDIHCALCDAVFSNQRRDGEVIECPECGTVYLPPRWERDCVPDQVDAQRIAEGAW